MMMDGRRCCGVERGGERDEKSDGYDGFDARDWRFGLSLGMLCLRFCGGI